MYFRLTDILNRKLVESVVLGVVQGITEFLPISSDGHLVVVEKLMHSGTREEPLALIMALHVGTLLSILVVYRHDLFRLVKDALAGDIKLAALIVLATIPVGVVGVLFKKFFEQTFQSPLIAGIGFLVTAGFLFMAQRLETNARTLDQIGTGTALVIGLFQALAPFPGVSRSGCTIAAGLLCGMRREAATTFSFLIAIPAIAGASVFILKDLLTESGPAHNIPAMLLGGVTAFVVGLIALRWLIRIVNARKLHYFAWYLVAAGLLTILWQIA